MADIVIMPKLGFDMAEGTLVRWVVAEGEEITQGAVLAEIETDKATVEVESDYGGVVVKRLIDEGAIVPIGTPIAVIGGADEEIDFETLLGEIPGVEEPAPAAAAHEKAEAVEVRDFTPGAQLPGGVKASPLARRMAKEIGIDLGKLKGSGPGGRIIKADIESYREPAAEAAERVEGVTPLTSEEPRPDKHVPLSRLRAAIGRRMTGVKQQVPHFYITHEYDVGAVMDLRAQVNALLPEGEKTSINDYIVKAAAMALREYPNLNAALNEEKNEVLHYGQINIGVAVAVENGLLTVVCRDTDRKPVRQIAAELRTKVGRARRGKVRPGDIEGSTFSISNLGMFDVEHFIAIINPPEAAILAVGSVREVPVVNDGNIQSGRRLKATISVDHRVSDGAEAARFLQALAKYLEEPLRLMI